MFLRKQTVVISLLPQQCRVQSNDYCQKIHDLDIEKGELKAPQQLAEHIIWQRRKKSNISIVIDDDWLDYHCITLNSNKRRVQQYLIKRQRKSNHLYDVLIQQQQAHLWQLPDDCYKSYVKLCLALSSKLICITPLSQHYVQQFALSQYQAVALYASSQQKLYIFKDSILLFSQTTAPSYIKQNLTLCQDTYALKVNTVIDEQGEIIHA